MGNCSFEDGPTAWAFNNVDIWSGWVAADGLISIDLNACGPGNIYQDLTTIPGHYYRLTFAMSANPDGGPATREMTVDFGGTQVADLTLAVGTRTDANMQWVYSGPNQPEYIVQATSSTSRLQFNGSPNDGNTSCYGPAVDDVTVVDLGTTNPNGGTPTPELGSGELLAIGLLPFAGLLLYRRRRTRQQ